MGDEWSGCGSRNSTLVATTLPKPSDFVKADDAQQQLQQQKPQQRQQQQPYKQHQYEQHQREQQNIICGKWRANNSTI